MHESVVHRNDAPVFFQFGQGARYRAAEIDQELVGAVIEAGRPAARPALAAVATVPGPMKAAEMMDQNSTLDKPRRRVRVLGMAFYNEDN